MFYRVNSVMLTGSRRLFSTSARLDTVWRESPRYFINWNTSCLDVRLHWPRTDGPTHGQQFGQEIFESRHHS